MNRQQAGQVPGVVKVRLSGAPADIQAIAIYLAGRGLFPGDGIEVIEQSAPYPNRRNPGERVYLTVRVSTPGGAR